MNLTNSDNLSYTARRVVGYDLKGQIKVFWKIGVKEAESLCANMGIPFRMSVNKETMIDIIHYERIKNLEIEKKLIIRK